MASQPSRSPAFATWRTALVTSERRARCAGLRLCRASLPMTSDPNSAIGPEGGRPLAHHIFDDTTLSSDGEAPQIMMISRKLR